MKSISRKSIIYAVGFVIAGVLLNRITVDIVAATGCPLYLDSIGTMLVAAVAGLAPGTTVGFITNMIGGLSDTNTFYYGIINVFIAVIVGTAAGRGHFKKPLDIIKILPLFLLLSIPCSFLSNLLYAGEIADNVAAPVARAINKAGFPVVIAQMLADFCIEIPDKFISLVIAFLLTLVIPQAVKDELIGIAGRDVVSENRRERIGRGNQRSLRRQVAKVLLVSGLAIALVAFFISYKTYMEAKVAGYPDGDYDVVLLRTETLLYCGKMFSAILGLLICIVSYSMIIVNYRVVSPLHRMATEMSQFAYDTETGRNHSVEKIEALDIDTGNEIEILYRAMTKTVKDIDEYIDTTAEQAKTIADLNVNIITTLADIVESRDETTGFHVKKTAEYCEILAEELKSKGLYADELTDEFISTLKIAAPLHDIGKIKIPDAILNKPARLTDEEYAIIKTHVVLGREMLDNASENLGTSAYLHMAKDIAYSHHEWWDGSSKGYPGAASGTDIPLSARIMAVADVFDALVSKRPYKNGFSMDKAIEIMVEESGTHFDPDIINAVLDTREKLGKVIEKYSE